MTAITSDLSDRKRALRLIVVASTAFTVFVGGVAMILAVLA